MFWNRLSTTIENDASRGISAMIGRQRGHQHPAGPAFNIWVDEDGAVLTSELPGVAMKDLEITVSGRDISVKGSRAAESTGNTAKHLRRERATGAFERKFRLDMEIDVAAVQACLVNGVLEIRLPRAENDKPRKITVTGDKA